jgi:hypothetical protein
VAEPDTKPTARLVFIKDTPDSVMRDGKPVGADASMPIGLQSFTFYFGSKPIPMPAVTLASDDLKKVRCSRGFGTCAWVD